MKHLKIMTIVLLVVMCSIAGAQVFLDLEILKTNAQAFPIGDLNLASTTQTTNYFNVQIRNDGAEPVEMRLKLEILYNGSVIATGISNSFVLPDNGTTYLLTSQQLSLGTAMIDGQQIELGDYDVDFNAVGNLENQALQTGMAPAGIYNFILTAVDPNNPNNVLAPDQNQGNHTLNISNPTYIELLFPGRSINDPAIEEIGTTTPYCQWQTDVPPSNASYNIFFYEKQTADISVQDVLNHPPVLQVEGYTNNFLQYPTDTSIDPVFKVVRPLGAGKIYYWFVRSIIQTGTGTITLESDIFRFKISDVAQTNYNAQQIISILQQLLGSQYESKLTDLIEQGFDPNGEISLDGQSGDIGTLLEIANQISSGQLNIEDVEIY